MSDNENDVKKDKKRIHFSFLRSKSSSKDSDKRKKLEDKIERQLLKADAVEKKQKKKSLGNKFFVKESKKDKDFDTSVIPSISLEQLEKEEENKKKFSIFDLFKSNKEDKKLDPKKLAKEEAKKAKEKKKAEEKLRKAEKIRVENEKAKLELEERQKEKERVRLEKEEEEKAIYEKKRQELEEKKALKEALKKEKAQKKIVEEEERKRLEEEKKQEKIRQKEEEQRKKEEEALLNKSQIETRKEARIKEKEALKEKKRLAREKKNEERKEKLRLKLEEERKKKKKEEEIEVEKQKEQRRKEEQIEKEKEQAKKEKKEKALLIKKAKEEAKEKKRHERKDFKQTLIDFYNNISFVRDAKNKRELQRETLLLDVNGADAERSTERILYKYVAKNSETGKVETGYFGAFSKLDVHSFLLAEGYEVYEITPQSNIKGGFGIKQLKLTSSELDFFLTQLSTFLRSGITLVESVKILSKQTNKTTTRNLYKSLVYELSMGDNFSDAMAKQGNVFPRLLINMIKTAELTGDLPETLDDMAKYYRESDETRRAMVGALTYPAVILVFAVTILIYIMVSVIPQFVSIYDSLDAELPGITVIIINVSNFLQSNWMWVVLGVVIFVVAFVILYKTIKVFKTVVQSLIMNIPIFGKIIIYNEVTMFTKTFASLLNHSVYITDCMEVLSKITNNEIYKMLIFDTITNLAKGEAISNSFKNHWAFPNIAYEMILTGEKTGQLGGMMDKVSTYYQMQHKNMISQIKAFIEPVMIVLLAFVVGVVLLAVILPMFDMYQNIG